MIKVQMTGQEDLGGSWNIAVAGFGGTGKSLFASTAPSPLFVFFRETPTLKSIASRNVPYIILTNEYDLEGHLVNSMLDKLRATVMYLDTVDHKYTTLVIDTGDEMFQSMKEARRAQNRGEFGPGDWGWIGDAYREVMENLLALDMDVVVLYHVKNSQLDDGVTYRELMLQGVATDEAPSWFDVVVALDTFETTNEDGESVTRRVMLSHSSRLYPWLIDRSGQLPPRFELSEHLQGDFMRFKEVLTRPQPANAKQDVDEIPEETDITAENNPSKVTENDPVPVPSREELDQAKGRDAKPQVEDPALVRQEKDVYDSGVKAQVKAGKDDTGELFEQLRDEVADAKAQVSEPDVAEESERNTKEVTEVSEAGEVGEPERQPDEPGEAPPAPEAMSEADVKEDLDATDVIVCVECGLELDESMQEISQIKYRRYLCREHYKQAMSKGR